ncbi:chaperonin 10-like protein [Xylaria arbuscula]|nr:chaperonin 10-like protein [Xylaria arbuscula]
MATSIRSIKSLVPLLDRVLVQRIKAETKTASGIFLPESSVKELNEGRVLAVGPGALSKDGARVPMGVAQGDRVLIPQVSLTEVMKCWVDAQMDYTQMLSANMMVLFRLVWIEATDIRRSSSAVPPLRSARTSSISSATATSWPRSTNKRSFINLCNRQAMNSRQYHATPNVL